MESTCQIHYNKYKSSLSQFLPICSHNTAAWFTHKQHELGDLQLFRCIDMQGKANHQTHHSQYGCYANSQDKLYDVVRKIEVRDRQSELAQ